MVAAETRGDSKEEENKEGCGGGGRGGGGVGGIDDEVTGYIRRGGV